MSIKHSRWLKKIVFWAGCVGTGLGGWAPCAESLVIKVTKGVTSVIQLAVVGLDTDTLKIVGDDLESSGFFNLLHNADSGMGEYRPDLSAWKHIKGSVCASVKADETSSGLRARVTVYNVLTERKLGEVNLTLSQRDHRTFSHHISNAIYKILTGEPGYFDSVILYTFQAGPPTRKQLRIAKIDQDGARCRLLTSARENCYLPRCAQNKRLVAYVKSLGYTKGGQLEVLNFDSGTRFSLPVTGSVTSPRFSLDGSRIVYAKNDESGGACLYNYDMNAGRSTQLTYASQDSVLDVSPSYSPDGQFIVFASTRGYPCRPKLYVMRASGGSPVCITQRSGKYFSPVWSPDGKWIAAVKQEGGKYFLCVLSSDGGRERYIATDYMIDQPSWAPNSRCIVFSSQQRRHGPFRLFVVHAFGNPSGKSTLRHLVTSLNGQVHEGNLPDWCLYKGEAAQ